MSEMTPRRRGTSPVPPASIPDDDDLLREILPRLPPQPSSLPRASAVCKRWRSLVTDPQFLRRFRVHHRKPPLLGVFEHRGKIAFRSILDPPDRIPPERFSLRRDGGRIPPERFSRRRHIGMHMLREERFSLQRHDDSSDESLLGCRHGLVLVINGLRGQVIVCDPITGERRSVAIPPDFKRFDVRGTVLCAAGDRGHVHGGCHSRPFKVVLVDMYRGDRQPIARVYSLETGVWGNLISTAVPCLIFDAGDPVILAGNGLYWLLRGDGILEFDLDRQSLAVIKGPPITNDTNNCCQIIKLEHGNVCLAVLSYPMFEMWQRKVNCHGVATWVLRKTVEIHDIPGLPSKIEEATKTTILGYAEDVDVVFLYVATSVYMVQVESMQARRLYDANYSTTCHPFVSFYTPGAAIAGGYDGADIIHDT